MAGKSERVCSLCNKRFGKVAMSRHLLHCLASHSTGTGKAVPRVLIAVDGYNPYWLHVDAGVNATLGDLDGLLRAIWLECCGHMSQFTIGKVLYDSGEDSDFGFGPPSRSMNTKLGAVFAFWAYGCMSMRYVLTPSGLTIHWGPVSLQGTEIGWSRAGVRF